ncbi:MAG: hypothetical protein KA419_13170 [Acidobacteria bacterium]|nr:hypothetical protein [Acidobacteriota bacterium]
MIRTIVVLLGVLTFTFPVAGSGSVPESGMKQYVYILRLVPRLLDDQAWTDKDNAIVGSHFEHLRRLTLEGTVILAGRTLEATPLGIVVFEAPSDAEARKIMESDPAVAGGIMTGEVHPFRVALLKGLEPPVAKAPREEPNKGKPR